MCTTCGCPAPLAPSSPTLVHVGQAILAKNSDYAQKNRRTFADKHILAVNLLSSPGSGKTSLLVETIHRLKRAYPISVIEGDQSTQRDAERIRASGVAAYQINTGTGCHLDAMMIAQACEQLTLTEKSLLFIENVGNLVCPAEFDLGEAYKVVVLSITEGEDKPLKYSPMFHAADLVLLNKMDLLPHLDFDVELCIKNIKRINQRAPILSISARDGSGLDEWTQWIRERV